MTLAEIVALVAGVALFVCVQGLKLARGRRRGRGPERPFWPRKGPQTLYQDAFDTQVLATFWPVR